MATTITHDGFGPCDRRRTAFERLFITARVDRQLGVVMITRAGQVRFLAAPSLAEITSPARDFDPVTRLARCQPGIFNREKVIQMALKLSAPKNCGWDSNKIIFRESCHIYIKDDLFEEVVKVVIQIVKDNFLPGLTTSSGKKPKKCSTYTIFAIRDFVINKLHTNRDKIGEHHIYESCIRLGFPCVWSSYSCGFIVSKKSPAFDKLGRLRLS